MTDERIVDIFRLGDSLCMMERNGGNCIKTEEDIETALMNIERKLRFELGLQKPEEHYVSNLLLKTS